MSSDFKLIIEKEIDEVLESNRDLKEQNHRREYPWATGFLGNMDSRIIFLAENPSLGQIKKKPKMQAEPPDVEYQWNVSRGDHIFREALHEAGFKEGTPQSKGGWKCYITNIIKMADKAGNWRDRGWAQRFDIALKFESVLRIEIERVHPVVIVLMGKNVKRYFKELKEHVVPHPDGTQIEYVKHYGFFNYRPLNDVEVTEYKEHFQRIKGVYDSLISHA